MKKAILLVLVVLLTLSLGCQNAQKTDEELRSEVLDELKDEGALNLDVRDTDALYQALADDLLQGYTKEQWDRFEQTYMDIDQDGFDEVVLIAPFGEGPLEEVVFVTGKNGSFEVIDSDIELWKYQNEVAYADGLIGVTQASGGSGIRYGILSFYVYDGEKILYTGTSVNMEDILSEPGGYEITGEIKGPWTDFTHVLTKRELSTDASYVIETNRYLYDATKQTFTQEMQGVLLSTSMDKGDIIASLGEGYEVEFYLYSMDETLLTTYRYPGISFTFPYENNQVPNDAKPIDIEISSNDYYYHYDVQIGDKAKDAIAKCASKFDKVENIHGGPGEVVPDWFVYKEVDADGKTVNDGFVLGFEYDTQERYSDLDEIGEDVTVMLIKLMGYYE